MAKLSRPMVRTPRTTYYSAEFSNSDEYRRRTSKGIHNQNKIMTRLSNKYKIKAQKSKNSGGSGG